ncbi:dipeptidyl aminopeptidase/acylaminoacyl peptidase [Cryobacterium sp. CAN_C3]|uniref:S9 family peptidase n=1 Tax=unclassified Cryobacterium TaxID=2649013 RepID=UPI0018CAC7DD|nr:S9 family peptidase [Cryobacterium sp. CAN_C3]MEC5154663.1 dipeptidyl aminopeptidase/acylaminoacyl peptidase [Cryobacterium sp. CAN_C3]
MKAADLPLLALVAQPTIHPDGSRAVFSRTHADFAADDYVGQLWTVALVGEPAPRRITRGFRDSAPRFSPDGTLIGFLRASAGGTPQLHVVDAAGGEPVVMTDAALGVTDFRWHPSGDTIAFVARVPEQGRYGTVAGLSADSEPARRILTLRYRSNGVGYTIDRRTHVFLAVVPNVWAEPTPAPAPSAATVTSTVSGTGHGADLAVPAVLPSGLPIARQLTDGVFDHSGLAFSPDGSRLLTISARHAGRDNDLRSEIVELDLEIDHTDGAQTIAQARVVLRSAANLSVSALACADDGTLWLLASDVGATGRDFVGRATALYRVGAPFDGSGPIRVTDPDQTDTDRLDLDASGGITPLPDGSVFALGNSRGKVELIRVRGQGQVEAVECGAAVVSAVNARGATVVVAVQSAGTSGDLVLVHTDLASTHAQDTAPKRLTDFCAALRATGLVTGLEYTVTARDGYPVHGWVHIPHGPGPHPVLLTIHGGPFAQYTSALLDETQVYVDAGYAVVMCNPRGSSGYGEAHGRAIRQRMGTLDLADVVDFLDGALQAEPALDAHRVGIMGGSYGGYLTAWTIAHEHRFAAAIVERGFLDPDAFVGTSDIGDYFGDEYVGTDADLLGSQSPQFMVGRVRTPTLVLHSAQDLRCPLSQGERYYAALKRGGVPTELVIFPGENHDLSRTGRPRHRLQRFEIILDWWARHLPAASHHRRFDEHDHETGRPVT